MDQRTAQRGALLHAAGKLPRKMILKALEADESEQIASLRAVSGAVASQPRAMRLHDLERQHHIVEGSAPRQQGWILERHADDRQWSRDFLPGHHDCPGRRRPQSGDDFHEGGLAASGWPDHRDKFSGPNVERGVVERKGAVAVFAVAQGYAIEIDEAHRLIAR